MIPPHARRGPWLTIAVTLVTAAFFGWQLTDDRVVPALQRDPAGLHWSSAWRVFTPLLIQSDGWGQALFNVATLVVFGVLVERAFGRTAWLVAYLGAGVAGQLVGYAWNPPGGGNSVAVCGLVGLIVAAMLVGRPVLPGAALLLAPYYPAALLGLHLPGRFGQAITLAATGLVLGTLIVVARRTQPAPDRSAPDRSAPDRSAPGRSSPDQPGLSRGSVVGLGGLMVAEAVALVAYQDHHGAALLTGVAIGLAVLASRRAAPLTQRPYSHRREAAGGVG